MDRELRNRLDAILLVACVLLVVSLTGLWSDGGFRLAGAGAFAGLVCGLLVLVGISWLSEGRSEAGDASNGSSSEATESSADLDAERGQSSNT